MANGATTESDEVSKERLAALNNAQTFMILDGAMTAALAAMVALIVATFIHKEWAITQDWVLYAVILIIGTLGYFQRDVQKKLDRLLDPRGESEERIMRLLREVLAERSDDREVVNERPDDI
jgi:hypothetical protein